MDFISAYYEQKDIFYEIFHRRKLNNVIKVKLHVRYFKCGIFNILKVLNKCNNELLFQFYK